MQRTSTVVKLIAPSTDASGSKRLLKDYEVEARYGISRFTLRADRIHDRRFKFIKIGRSVFYRTEDIELMLDRHAIVGTETEALQSE